MFQVQHLVVDDVLHRKARHVRLVKDLADHDGIVRGIVVAQQMARALRAPAHLGPPEQTIKEADIQRIEDLVQIVAAPLRRLQALASAHLPYPLRLLHHLARGDVAAVARTVRPVDRAAVNLGQKDVDDGLQHRLRRALQQVGKAQFHPAVRQANSVVDVDEGIELQLEFRKRGARPQLAVGLLQQWKQCSRQGVSRLSEAAWLLGPRREGASDTSYCTGASKRSYYFNITSTSAQDF